MATRGLVSLPRDILVLLPDFLHTIEDYMNLASSNRTLRECMSYPNPNTILRLAAAQSRIFFRPSPHVLVAATARELGYWARRSDENEAEFASRMEEGIEALLDLALAHCGLTMERIRELHIMRFSIINPVTDIVDKCVGTQWCRTPHFWNGGVSDAYTIRAESSETFFHLAIYGELFSPDIETILNQDTTTRRLRVETRLEFMKYCVPDFVCEQNGCITVAQLPDGTVDPRRDVKQTGPYKRNEKWELENGFSKDNNLALTWLINSSRWKPHMKAVRERTGMPDFQNDFDDGWWYDENELPNQDWRQRLWQNVMNCQGLEGLGMIRPELMDQWVPKVREWREKIARLEKEPPTTMVGKQGTLEYPYLLGDLRICASW